MILFNCGAEIVRGENIEWKVSVGAGQQMDLVLVGTSSGSADLDIEIVGEGASVSVKGLCLCGGQDSINVRVNLVHKVGGSTSDQLFRCVAAQKGRIGLNGRIVVCQDAQKTEAYQNCRSLQLGDEARVETSPQLEIYADDVKCSHGATTGSLDEDEQFYMRSRGISLEQARHLQIVSFLAPVMEAVPEGIVDLDNFLL